MYFWGKLLSYISFFFLISFIQAVDLESILLEMLDSECKIYCYVYSLVIYFANRFKQTTVTYLTT